MPDDEHGTEGVRARYDSIADGYVRWWAPVIRPASLELLDAIAPAVEAGATRLLDVGVGSGTLAIAALERWHHLRATGVDVSSEMLAVAEREARGARVGDRLELVRGTADRMPVPDGGFDIVVSTFVLQLVPHRGRALAEMRRAVRPGGTVAWTTWLVGGERFRGDEIVDAVLDEAGYEKSGPDPRSGDVASVAAAARATRRAGLRRVSSRRGELVQRWDAEGFAAFVARFDEADLFDEMGVRAAPRVEARLVERLRTLTPEELTLRLPTVSVVGVAPER